MRGTGYSLMDVCSWVVVMVTLAMMGKEVAVKFFFVACLNYWCLIPAMGYIPSPLLFDAAI